MEIEIAVYYVEYIAIEKRLKLEDRSLDESRVNFHSSGLIIFN